ncbi:MAG: hypothetical protein HRT43_07450 [Campylobacteraceae bacterium]|nr:hypothetical protein [Campylobacteraceae bacterium]
MNISNPAVRINKNFPSSYAKKKFGFATVFIHISCDSLDGLELFFNYNEALKSKTVVNNKQLNISIRSYFENGGVQLYLLSYNSDNMNLFDFENFVKTNCDNLVELEILSTPTLLSQTNLAIKECIKIYSFLGKYAQVSNRIFITDVNERIINEYLDVLEECVIYHPWFIHKNGELVAPSVVASALMAKSAIENNFFHSIANKKISSLHKTEVDLTKEQTLTLQKEFINPIIQMHNDGLKIWGVNAFNSNYSSVNELRVIQYIKRSLKVIMREDLFEINSENLHDKIFSKVNKFLQQLWQIGALNGEAKDEAFIIESRYEEMKDSDNTLVFAIKVSISKPLQFINIKLERVQRDGMVENISVEV